MADIIPKDCLVVVADGTRAVLFHQSKGGPKIKLRQLEELTPINLDDDGPAGVRPPESTLQETDQATFAKQLAHVLNGRALKQEFENLVLVADPQTLGQIRPSLHKEVEDRLICDIGKNLVGSPVAEIEKALANNFQR